MAKYPLIIGFNLAIFMWPTDESSESDSWQGNGVDPLFLVEFQHY